MNRKIEASRALSKLRQVRLPQHESLDRVEREIRILIEDLETNKIDDKKFYPGLSAVITLYRTARKEHSDELFSDEANEAMDILTKLADEVR